MPGTVAATVLTYVCLSQVELCAAHAPSSGTGPVIKRSGTTAE